MSLLLRSEIHAAVCASLISACASAAPSPPETKHVQEAGIDASPERDAEAGAPTRHDSSTGAEGGGRPLFRRDAGPAVSATDDLPQRTADAGAKPGSCRGLAPWNPPARITDVSVVRGGDGFAGMGGPVVSYTSYVFDVAGNATVRIGTSQQASPGGYGLRGAAAGGGVAVAVAECGERHGYSCGSVLQISGERPVTIQPPVFISANPHAAVNARGDILLANLALPADAREPPQAYHSYDVRLLDSHGQLRKTSTLETDDFTLIDVATGSAGTVLLLGRQRATDAGNGLDEILVSLDENLKRRGVEVVPVGRAARSLAMKEGTVVVVGTAVDGGGSRVWLDALDAVTLKQAWAAERLGSPGVGIAVDVAPSGLLVTLATTGDGDGFVVQKYDAEGAPEADTALVATIGDGAAPSGPFNPGVALESDGSVFVVTPIGAFVACP